MEAIDLKVAQKVTGSASKPNLRAPAAVKSRSVGAFWSNLLTLC